MPTYDYQCEECGHSFEAFQSMKDEPLKKCPECGKDSLKRLIGTGAGVIFKGSGFYETDYKKAKAPADSKPEKSGNDSAAKSDSGSKSKGSEKT